MKFLFRGWVDPTMKSTTLLEYAEYRARTTSSAVAPANAAGSVCSLPQHFMYPNPEPQGHGTTAAPPNPEVDPLFLLLGFGLVPFLASSCSSDGDDGGWTDEHDDLLCKVNDTQGAASVKRRSNLLMMGMVSLYWYGDGSKRLSVLG